MGLPTAQQVLSSIRNATVMFAGGILLLLGGGAGFLLAAKYAVPTESAGSVLLHGIGEAALISAVLALLVDPYLKRRLRDESGWQVLIGYFNPLAPKSLRSAVRELASGKIFNQDVVWTVTFEWADDTRSILALTIESLSSAVNLDRRQHKMDDHSFVLASTDGYQSQYLRYSLSCPGHFPLLDMQGQELDQFTRVNDNGSVSLDDEQLCDGRPIPPNAQFEYLRRTLMFRRNSGYLPLQHGQFAEKISVVLRGAALSDLDLIVSPPRRLKQKEPVEWRRSAAPPDEQDSRFSFKQVSPGQTTLVSWGPAKSRRN